MTLKPLSLLTAKGSMLLKAVLFLFVAVAFVSCSEEDPYAGFYGPTKEQQEQQKNLDDATIHKYFKNNYKFFEDNGLDTTDIVKTSTGLYYLKLEEGTGAQVKAGDAVNVHYVGKSVANSVFDSSYERGRALPVTVGAGGVIKGWDEGLQLMKRGERAIFYIPSHLGYGYRGSGSIPPNAVLIFDIEVLEN